MPAYNGVFAAICVDGELLDEYQVQVNDAEKEISCWIPSQVGKEFTIGYENPYPDKCMCLDVEIVGSWAGAWYVAPQKQRLITACPTSSTTERPFVFSEGQLVDDDDIEGEIPDVNNLGTITLVFHEGYAVAEQRDVPTSEHAIPEQRQIPERGKKGVQTCVALGAVRAKVTRRQLRMKLSNNNTRIVFRYRPLEYLQAQGIAPLPKPPPEPQQASPDPQITAPAKQVKRKGKDDIESQSGPSKARRIELESRKLADVKINQDEDVEKLLALRAQIDKALAEKNVVVKKEIKAEPRAVFLKGEVIDLT